MLRATAPAKTKPLPNHKKITIKKGFRKFFSVFHFSAPSLLMQRSLLHREAGTQNTLL